MFRSISQATALAIVATCFAAAGCLSKANAQSSPLVGVVVEGRKYTGKVLFHNSTTLALLRRDGRLSTYSALDVDSAVALPKPFRPYSQYELEERLQSEFPRGYSVSFTDNFAVVFPTKSSFGWASKFERLYRQFTHYFEARGYQLNRSEFPLIAVVLGTRAEFDHYLEQTELSHPSDVVGTYSNVTNRIVTYDQAISSNARNSGNNLVTVIHEATHQSAFNTGIHKRFRPIPHWVTEGLATMFEAPGVHNSSDFPEQRDRVATNYLGDLQSLIATDSFRGKIQSVVCTDQLFELNPRAAYATAWGLTFYLAENRPRDYQEYLRATNQREDFSRDNPEQRLHDFRAIFGEDLNDLETRVVQYFQSMHAAR